MLRLSPVKSVQHAWNSAVPRERPSKWLKMLIVIGFSAISRTGMFVGGHPLSRHRSFVMLIRKDITAIAQKSESLVGQSLHLPKRRKTFRGALWCRQVEGRK